MKNLIIIFALSLGLMACNNAEKTNNTNTQSDASYEDALAKINSSMHQAKVLEATTSGSYTYVKLEENGKTFMAAVSAREVKIGDTYYYKDAMEMKNFESKSLGKVFSSIFFINDFYATKPEQKEKTIGGEHKNAQDIHAKIKVEKAADGYTLAEVFKKKSKLKDQMIIVKGQVVKINEEIMKTNWVHIQDGTEYKGLFDLTLTTSEAIDFKVGDVVTFKGKLILNKDFGHGYKYDFLLEDSKKQ